MVPPWPVSATAAEHFAFAQRQGPQEPFAVLQRRREIAVAEYQPPVARIVASYTRDQLLTRMDIDAEASRAARPGSAHATRHVAPVPRVPCRNLLGHTARRAAVVAELADVVLSRSTGSDCSTLLLNHRRSSD
jgi:hypothetical protein